MRAARRAAPRAALAVLTVLGPLLFLLFAAPERASAASYQVTMKGYAFSPRTLTVDVGSTVTWTNQDTAPHDVKTTSGPASFHSPMLNKGQSWSFTFTKAGSYGYYCTVHPAMTAGIVVRGAAPATSAAPPSPAAPTTNDHSGGHPATVPGRPATPTTAPSTRAPATRTTRSPSASPSVSTASPAAVGSPPAPTAPQAQQTVPAARPLDPLLVLAGLVAGVAVLCLLLVGSRAAATREGGGD
ncbi:cupredoxin domain-containing protein [Streptomyces bluensis]|uniref:cupredoxin domain-containing protein n=1 Tax=Streptomyces bluensis TaxID=33897 RepID=UPI001675EC05|nr:cupredoxin family copper-binding protein [Streptomyces bluensis]GGZ71009.1 hypothetical protein GCM10010344_42180 [Streptomyces bluensis]